MLSHNKIIKSITKLTTEHQINNKELIVKTNKEFLIDLIKSLRKNLAFNCLVDIFAIDYPQNIDKRFTVVYNLLSIENNSRIRINIEVNEDEFIPSLSKIYSAAGWYEREVWDMFGILFVGNNDLRRILTDYGFSGHPMRKDFPLTGHVEVRFDQEKSKVVYEPVSLQQEFRSFDFESPWEGEKYILPGDEKATKK